MDESRWPVGIDVMVVSIYQDGTETAWPVEDLDRAIEQSRREVLDWGHESWVEATVPGVGLRVLSDDEDVARLAADVAALGLGMVA